MSAKMHAIEVLGHPIQYLSSGKGNPVVLLSSAPASISLWNTVMDKVSQRNRCIVLNTMGMGGSVQACAHQLNALLEQLQCRDVTLVLHGLGSVVGLVHAVTNQDNINSIILIDPYLPVNDMKESAPLLMCESMSILKDNLSNSQSVKQWLRHNMPFALSEASLNEAYAYLKDESSQAEFEQHMAMSLACSDKTSDINQLLEKTLESFHGLSLPKALFYTMPGFHASMSSIQFMKESNPKFNVLEVPNNASAIGRQIAAWCAKVDLVQALKSIDIVSNCDIGVTKSR